MVNIRNKTWNNKINHKLLCLSWLQWAKCSGKCSLSIQIYIMRIRIYCAISVKRTKTFSTAACVFSVEMAVTRQKTETHKDVYVCISVTTILWCSFISKTITGTLYIISSFRKYAQYNLVKFSTQIATGHFHFIFCRINFIWPFHFMCTSVSTHTVHTHTHFLQTIPSEFALSKCNIVFSLACGC